MNRRPFPNCAVALVALGLAAAGFFAVSGMIGARRGSAAALPFRAVAPAPAFEQRIGARLPLDARLNDETARSVHLGDAVGGRPALVVFGYFRCPQLCSVLERGLVDTVRQLSPDVGRDFSVVYISIDPTDTPADARLERDAAARQYGRQSGTIGWNYLTGSAEAVAPVAAAAGFQYRYDPATRQYSHPTGFVIVTPDGVLSRYFLGLELNPTAIADALRRARLGQTGQPAFGLILECFRGTGVAGRYGPLIWRVLEAAVALTAAVVFGGIGWLLVDERKAASG